ncbi:MAG: glycosyltransferase family 4 protein [Halobacteria archaeon]
MRLLYVAPDIALDPAHPTGGATRVREVAHHLAALGHEVWVIARRSSREEPSEGELEPGVRVLRLYRGVLIPLAFEQEAVGRKAAGSLKRLAVRAYLGGPYRWWVLRHALRLIRNHRIEGVVERAHAYGAGVAAARRRGLPSVVEVVDADYRRTALERADRVLSNAPEIVEGIPADKVRIYALGGSPERFRPRGRREEFRRRLGLSGPAVVYTGALKPWHGVEEAIEAMARVEATFVVVGGTPADVARLQEFAESKGVASKVRFTGSVPYDEVPGYLEAADVAVAPFNPAKGEMTRRFGYYFSPIKLFEYMAAGKPIVASGVGQVPAILDGGRRGLLVEPGNPKALAGGLNRLLSDSVLAGDLGKRASEAAGEYSWERVARTIHDALVEAAAERRK